jgi:hypothetical protein
MMAPASAFFQDGSSFPLSDGTSLLLRLQMEGIDVGDRPKEQARCRRGGIRRTGFVQMTRMRPNLKQEQVNRY